VEKHGLGKKDAWGYGAKAKIYIYIKDALCSYSHVLFPDHGWSLHCQKDTVKKSVVRGWGLEGQVAPVL
jgi:hypothetical protein